MKLTAFALATVFLPCMTLSASAQSMTETPPQYTTTPPQYTTTPSQYTTIPSQYTTTPAQYTTTPPQYIAPVGTTPTTPPTTSPTRPPTTSPQFPTTNPQFPTTIPPYPTPTTSFYSTTPMTYPFQSTLLESEMVDEVDMGEQRVQKQTAATSPAEGLVASYAQRVLGLDEVETQQFVSDFADVANELGFAPNEVSLGVGVKVVLYLSLKRILGLSTFAAA